MIGIWVAFITGLTTGGLGCLALQGGLLASSLAQQAESGALRAPGSAKASGKPGSGMAGVSGAGVARSIALFLGAKVVVHGMLGILLGALGSFLRLNYLTRALLQLGIGIFMIGSALRMLDVHPIFRYFAFEPPAFISRAIRRTSRREASAALPIVLGVLTVFIPCGVTQAMMATAMATGDALLGGAMMAAFTLGTTPMFFAVAYSAMRVGAKLEHAFMRVIAVVVLILGLVAVESGLNLLGSPVSVSRLASALRQGSAAVPAAPSVVADPTVVAAEPPPAVVVDPDMDEAPAAGVAEPEEEVAADPEPVEVVESEPEPEEPEIQIIYVQAAHDGYFPMKQHARADVPSELVLITDMTRSCTRALAIPALRFETYLPESGQVKVDVPAMAPGSVLRYSCAAGIYTGEIIFDR